MTHLCQSLRLDPALGRAAPPNADEDTPRLALADWLDDHGTAPDRARAVFIRLQVKAAKYPIGSPNWNEHTDKADAIHKKHAKTWFAPLAPLAPKVFSSGSDSNRTSRGLLECLMVHTDGFLLKAHQPLIPDALAAAGVENLHFYSATKKIEAFASSPAFKWVSGFSYPEADDTALALFGGSDTMAHLRDIELTEVKVTDAGLEAFARDSRTTKLRTFGCTVAGTMKTLKGKYTAAGLLAILESKRFPRLCELDLDTEQPAKFDWAALLASPALKRFRKFTLGGKAPFAAVATCPHFTALESLTVYNAFITDADIEALLASKALKKLTALQFHGANWGRPRLTPAVQARFEARFGEGAISYSPEEK
jgi:uncharacterized protein (TIGR02996 family)